VLTVAPPGVYTGSAGRVSRKHSVAVPMAVVGASKVLLVGSADSADGAKTCVQPASESLRQASRMAGDVLALRQIAREMLSAASVSPVVDSTAAEEVNENVLRLSTVAVHV